MIEVARALHRLAGRFFLEPATFARALFPGSYDAGVALGGQWRWLRYDVAAMNGAPSGDAQFGASMTPRYGS